jgi:hypothetical protein
MWCFIDESWQKSGKQHVGVLGAVIGSKQCFTELERFLYALRKKYYGDSHAKDLRSELKGSSLFSNSSLKIAAKGYSKNLCIAREILEWIPKSSIRYIAICVYGDESPPLLTPKLKLLSTPFRELCNRILAQIPQGKTGELIFDQRIGAQEDISLAVYYYLAGIANQKRLLPNPLIGVSNVWAGLQLADIIAFVIGRYSLGDRRFWYYYDKIQRMQMKGKDHHKQKIYGLLRLQWNGGEDYTLRKIRTKK